MGHGRGARESDKETLWRVERGGVRRRRRGKGRDGEVWKEEGEGMRGK